MKLSFICISKQILLAALCGLSLAGCQESSPPNAATKAKQESSASAKAPSASAAAAGAAEYLDWNTATINGTQPLIGKTDALFKALGHPDSLANPDMNNVCTSFYDRKFRYAYFKESVVEVYADTAVIGALDFRRNPQLALHAPTIRLNQNTTLADLARQFPKAVKEKYTLDVYGIGKVTAVNLATGKMPSDDSWLLLFDAGKLIRIDYWMPC